MKPVGISRDQVSKELVEIINDVYPNIRLYRKFEMI